MHRFGTAVGLERQFTFTSGPYACLHNKQQYLRWLLFRRLFFCDSCLPLARFESSWIDGDAHQKLSHAYPVGESDLGRLLFVMRSSIGAPISSKMQISVLG